MYGGSFANGVSLCPFCIFNCAPLLSWTLGGPTSNALAANGKHYSMAWTYNESGGATGTTFLDFIKAQFGSLKDAEGNDFKLHDQGLFFTASKEDPVILVVDGHGSHFTPEVLDFCIANGIHLVLRQQHTSHV